MVKCRTMGTFMNHMVALKDKTHTKAKAQTLKKMPSKKKKLQILKHIQKWKHIKFFCSVFPFVCSLLLAAVSCCGCISPNVCDLFYVCFGICCFSFNVCVFNFVCILHVIALMDSEHISFCFFMGFVLRATIESTLHIIYKTKLLVNVSRALRKLYVAQSLDSDRLIYEL